MLIQNNGVQCEFVNFHAFFRDKKISIPLFQRFYDWKKQQVEEILNDVSSLLENPIERPIFYFLDFIYYEEEGKIVIADGQQRLVSINLFRLAIANLLGELGNLKEKEAVRLYDISYEIEGYEQKYQKTVSSYPVAPFKNVYMRFYSFLKENETRILDILDILNNRLWIYAKRCDSGNDAFDIFQQINTGGKPLTKDEIMKTTIQQCSALYGLKPEFELKDLSKKISSYQKFLFDNASSSSDMVFLMKFLKESVVKDKDTFQNFLSACKTLDGLKKNPLLKVIAYIQRPALLDIVYVMAMKQIDLNHSGEYVTNVVAPLCLMSVCLTLNKANPGGIIKTLYADIVKRVKAGEGAKEIGYHMAEFVNDNAQMCTLAKDEFVRALSSPDTKLGLKKGLLVLDVILSNASSQIDLSEVDVEHIYPQNPCAEWALHGWPTSEEERRNYIHNIGTCSC